MSKPLTLSPGQLFLTALLLWLCAPLKRGCFFERVRLTKKNAIQNRHVKHFEGSDRGESDVSVERQHVERHGAVDVLLPELDEAPPGAHLGLRVSCLLFIV